MFPRTVHLAAILLTALALVPGGAHLFALPNKIALGERDYFTVQGIYAGWAVLGVLLVLAIAADGLLAYAQRADRAAFLLALAGALCLAATLAVFFVLIYPGNQATANWTTAPADWRALRLRWEYGHALNAVLTFIGLVCVSLSVLFSPPR